MARRRVMVRRRRGASRSDNPRGYIRYRGRWIASAPFYTAGRVVPRGGRRDADDNPRRRRRSRRVRYSDNPRRHRRSNPRGYVRVRGRRGRSRWHRITDYARRRRGRIRGFRFPRGLVRGRRRRRVYHRNPVMYSDNPRRRYSRRRRRHYDDNPRHRGRRRRMIRLLDNPVDAIRSAIEEAFSGDTLETVFHTALGFGGTAVGARLLYKKVIPALGESGIGRVLTTLGVGVLGSGLVGMVTGDVTLATRWLAGGLVTTLWQGVSEVLPADAKELIPTLGEPPEQEAFRREIEKEVLKEIRGGRGRAVGHSGTAAGAEGMVEYIQPAGVEYVVPAAGSETYLTASESERATGAGNEAYLTSTEAERSTGLSDAEAPFEEFGSKTLVEKF